MSKYTRTAYASNSLGVIARELARRAGVDNTLADYVGMHDLHAHKGAGRRRVRITILVEPEKAPVKPSGPRRPRPVQASLPLEGAPA